MLITCPKCSTKYQIPSEAHLSAGRKVKCSHCQNIFVLAEQDLVDSGAEEMVVPPEMVEIDPQGTSEAVAEDQKVFEDQPVFQDDVPQPFVPVASSEPENKKAVGSWAAVISLLLLLILLGVGVFYRDLIFDAFSPQMSLPKVPARKVAEITHPVEPKPIVMPVVEEVKKVEEPYVEGTPEIVMLPQIQSVRFEKRLDPVPTIRIEGILKNGTATAMTLPAKVRAIAYNAEGAILFEKEIYLTDLILPAGEERPFFGSYQPAPDGVQWVDVTF